MITLKILRWSNCFSYGADNELILDKAVITQLIGTNGMGKSSIPLIVEEVSFNKNSKGIKKADIPNRYKNNGYDIYLLWDKDGDTYELTVNRKTGIKVKLTKNGEDISSHTATGTYKTVQEILGIDFKTFSQLVYQNTNTSLQFLTATDTNRKKFFIDLFHYEGYIRLFEVFKNATKDVNTELTKVESSIATIEKWLNDNELTDTTILPTKDFEIDTEDDEKQLRSLLNEIENISEKNKKILQNNQYKELLKQIDLKEIQSVEVTSEKSYDALQERIGRIKNSIETDRRRLKKLESLGQTCPTCEQEVDTAVVINWKSEGEKQIEKNSVILKKLTEEIAQIQKDNLKYRQKVKLQKDWEDLYRNVDNTLPKKPLVKDTLDRKAKEVSARIEEAREKYRKLQKENDEITRRNTRIQIILEQTDKFLEQLNTFQTLLDQHNKLFSNLEVLKKAFSPNGLLAYKIENQVKKLEELTNLYLSELSDGRFTLEFVVTNDKLNVQLTDNGEIVDILALSSGELVRVNIATLLAIRKLMSSISSSKINVLFLDEVINVLDDQGREKLVEVLSQEQDLNTFIVSHGWEHPLLAKISVVKDGNISRLEQ